MSTISSKPEHPAYLLAALCVIAIVVLTLHGDTIDETIKLLAATSLGVGGGVTISGNGKNGAPPAPPAVA
jgi:hypothetical protein